MPLKTLYKCQPILFRQDSVNINWVDIGFYALFARSILTQSLMVFKIKLRKERPMDTGNGVDSFFYQHLNTFSGRKIISRGYWGWQIFFWIFWKGEGVNFIMWKWKIWKGGGFTEIPSVVGVWIFSGNTHLRKQSKIVQCLKSVSTVLILWWNSDNRPS